MQKKVPKYSVVENDQYFFRDQEMFRANINADLYEEESSEKEKE